MRKDDDRGRSGRFARQAALTFGATVALKGARTFIAQAPENLGFCRLAMSAWPPPVQAMFSPELLPASSREGRTVVAACWGVFLTPRREIDSRESRPTWFLARDFYPKYPR